MLDIMLRGKVQLPAEVWGTEGLPFNEQFGIDPACESWDIVEAVAERLGVSVQFNGDIVLMWLNHDNRGEFDNSTGGIGLAMQFLRSMS